jgi:tetratricopeptide (TPR) repeat protein
LTNPLHTARTLASQSEYRDALKVIEDAEALGETSVELLLMKAKLLQLVDQDRTLEEVEMALESAIHIAPKSVEALLEMGWFKLNVRDDPKVAQKAFEAALQIQAEVNTELVLGLIKCCIELNPGSDLSGALQRAIASLVDEDRLKDVY